MLGTLPVEVYKSEFRHVEDVGFFLTAFSNSMTARATPPQDLCDASVRGVDKPGGKGMRVLWLLERLLGNTQQVRTRLRERRTFDTSLWLHSETKQQAHIWDPCSGVEDDTDGVRIRFETPRHGESFMTVWENGNNRMLLARLQRETPLSQNIPWSARRRNSEMERNQGHAEGAAEPVRRPGDRHVLHGWRGRLGDD